MRLGAFVLLQLVAVVGFAALLTGGSMPLGVRGEWEWLRVGVSTTAPALTLGIGAVLAWSALAALGARDLARRSGIVREAVWLAVLTALAPWVQLLVTEAAPPGFGLSKWSIALSNRGSSGYADVVREQVRDLGTFLKDYPEWIRRQDALHVGTHPPGLFVIAHVLRRAMLDHPDAARTVMSLAPEPVRQGFKAVAPDLPLADRAARTLTAALTWLACCGTVVPLYLLARTSLPAWAAWTAAAFWPFVPSTVMFQPAADTAFPLLSTTALALVAWGRGRAFSLVGAGLVLAIGMQLTLAFLAVGLVVALTLIADRERSIGARIRAIIWVGVGFFSFTLGWWAVSGANPFAVWWANQRNHGRFYIEFPRSYGPWLLETPIELAVSLGLPICLAALFTPWRTMPKASVATLGVLFLLAVSGKNLSETARLWLPFMPALVVLAAAGLNRLGGAPWAVAAGVGLVGIQTLILQASIQVVYPFSL